MGLYANEFHEPRFTKGRIESIRLSFTVGQPNKEKHMVGMGSPDYVHRGSENILIRNDLGTEKICSGCDLGRDYYAEINGKKREFRYNGQTKQIAKYGVLRVFEEVRADGSDELKRLQHENNKLADRAYDLQKLVDLPDHRLLLGAGRRGEGHHRPTRVEGGVPDRAAAEPEQPGREGA